MFPRLKLNFPILLVFEVERAYHLLSPQNTDTLGESAAKVNTQNNQLEYEILWQLPSPKA